MDKAGYLCNSLLYYCSKRSFDVGKFIFSITIFYNIIIVNLWEGRRGNGTGVF